MSDKDDTPQTDEPPRRICGTMGVHRRLLDSDPDYARRLERIEDMAFRARQGLIAPRTGCTQIPVVVHVVWNTPAQNVSQDQIDSQIRVLNEDFRKRNADVSTVPAAFAGAVGDARISFVLADRDPAGNAHSGVVRVQTSRSSFSDDDAVKHAGQGGSDAWPADRYLNLWVCQLSGGLLGYAQFPGGPAATDGVVVTHTAFGTTGTAAAPFDKGRTATHEIGHWLNLRHIWGDDGTGCSGTDFVDDTPNQGGPNTGKPTFPHLSCNNAPNGDMFMNYMDYVDDAAMVMFTAGQVTRMQACLDGPRSAIGTAVSCGGPKLPIKDAGKDPLGDGKIPVKDRPKDLIKDRPKEFAKELHKDTPKDGHKDWIKDSPKDAHKDIPKDNPKDLHKDTPKDGHKDSPKDVIKDRPKDLIKDVPFDTGPKKPILDNPKNVFEPGPDPKTMREPPFGGPFGPGGMPPVLGQPWGQPMGGMGAMPFTLGTGEEAADMGARVEEGAGADPAAHWAAILSHYAALYAQGMLDLQGMAAWQQAHDAWVMAGGQ